MSVDARAVREGLDLDAKGLDVRLAREALGSMNRAGGDVAEQARGARASGDTDGQPEPRGPRRELEQHRRVDEGVLEGSAQPGHGAEQVTDPHRGRSLHQLPREHLARDALERAPRAVAEHLLEREHRRFPFVERNRVERSRGAQPIERQERAEVRRCALGQLSDGLSSELAFRSIEQVPEEPRSHFCAGTRSPHH